MGSLDRRPPAGVVILSSCAEGEISREDPRFEHGVFMHSRPRRPPGESGRQRERQSHLGRALAVRRRKTKLHVAHAFSDSQRPKLKGNLTLEAFDFELSTVQTLEKLITNSIGMKLVRIPAAGISDGIDEWGD